MQDTGRSAKAPPARDRAVTVLVVDDQEQFREAVRDMVAAAQGFAIVGEASSGEEAARAVAMLAPELVLMDVTMPGMGGIAAARAILNLRPSTVVVLISVEDPMLYPGADSLGATVSSLRKQDLGPSRLKELWEARRN
jgi:DNA-binding NarL/FixJ family response regulator